MHRDKVEYKHYIKKKKMIVIYKKKIIIIMKVKYIIYHMSSEREV